MRSWLILATNHDLYCIYAGCMLYECVVFVVVDTYSSSKSSIAASIAAGAVMQHLLPRSAMRRALSA